MLILSWACDLLGRIRGKNEQVSSTGLLRFVGTAKVPYVESFMAKDHFLDYDSEDGDAMVDGVRIRFDWKSRFKEIFQLGDGKLETRVAGTTLHAHELLRESDNTEIIEELGGPDAAEVTLAHVWYLLQRQRRGGRGLLMVDRPVGCNIFYVRDSEGVLLEVTCHWDRRQRYWSVDASPIRSSIGWLGCVRIISGS